LKTEEVKMGQKWSRKRRDPKKITDRKRAKKKCAPKKHEPGGGAKSVLEMAFVYYSPMFMKYYERNTIIFSSGK
jgi:hypothetical protein